MMRAITVQQPWAFAIATGAKDPLPDGDVPRRTTVAVLHRRSWHLVLRDVQRLSQPVLVRGMQGLWSLPHDVEAQVREQLSKAAA